MKCEYCDNEVPTGSTRCPSCGAAVKAEPQRASAVELVPPETATPSVVGARAAKSRTVYIVLAILLGEFGVHNFYAGNTSRGVIQLALTLISCFWLGLFVWIWAIIEGVTTTKDATGMPFV